MVESSKNAVAPPVSVAPKAVFQTPPTIPVAKIPRLSDVVDSAVNFAAKAGLSSRIENDVPAHCDAHGAYLTSVLRIGSGLWRACPRCSAEEEARRRAEGERAAMEARQRFVDRALGSSGLPFRFREASIEGFHVETASDRRARDAAALFVQGFRERSGACLIFHGGVGTGKTHLASAIVRDLALKGFAAGYTTALEALQTIRATWGARPAETQHQVLSRLERMDLLVVDEVGRTFGTDAEAVQFFEVFNRRYRERRSTIIISNEDLGGIEASLGEAVFDRFRQDAIVVPFGGPSKRARFRGLS